MFLLYHANVVKARKSPDNSRGRGWLKELGIAEGFNESLEAGDGESEAEAADEAGGHGNRVGQA